MEQLHGESKMEFNERKQFYDFLLSKKIKDADKLSKIYSNIKFRKCKYSGMIYHYNKKLEDEFNKL